MPAISLIVPAYEYGPFFDDCLESICRQSFRDFELIVVDDYPHQSLDEIISKYAARLPRVRQVKNAENEGTLVSRLTGAEEASGDYVAFLDYDDTCHEDFLKKLYEAALASGADVVGSVGLLRKGREPFFIEGTSSLLQAYVDGPIDNWNVWTRLYRRDLLARLSAEKSRFRDHRITAPEDFAINMLCALQGHSYYQINELLVHHDTNKPDSVTNETSASRIFEKMASYANLIGVLKDRYAEHEDALDILLLRSIDFTYDTSLRHCDPDVFRKATERTMNIANGDKVVAMVLQCSEKRNRRLSAKEEARRRRTSLLRKLTGIHYLSVAKKKILNAL